ncbi:helix-turn-helix domain-containing protein [Actinomycetospora soli]|uniref:helix-turn-helix domain-containing protein n=1 Tax=Actinomycetospora soli TaxID=2893887 RepID=UPI001E2EC3BE|nr:helix-turn-helix domain-containing protein [Actinomycetospora soli]MCD2188894.1 helix-turn-helix domain-containing protein [Actinomycetospora soli]
MGRSVTRHVYDVRDTPPGIHRALPSPFLTFVVPVDEPLRMRRPDGGCSDFRACLAGLHDEPGTIVHPGHQAGIHVSVHPLAARALFGLPAAALAGHSVEAADVVGRIGGELCERVDAGATWPARLAALDDVLARLLRTHDDGPRAVAELRHAWGRVQDGGSVRDVAREVGWSTDHLSRRFAAEFGVRPSVAGRMARFDRVRREIARRAGLGALDLAGVAADHGYADQAHLAREFRALAGCSATTWVAEEVHGGLVGSVQDGPQADGPSSAA